MNSCEERDCRFWDGKQCNDPDEWINRQDGEDCCRYHLDAVPKTNGFKGLQAKVEQLEEELEKHRWIPISERLPEHDNPILIALASGNVIQGIKSCDLYAPDGMLWSSVTHWKPIIFPERVLKDKKNDRSQIRTA